MNTTTLLLNILLTFASTDDVRHACGQHVEEQHTYEVSSPAMFERMVETCLVEHSFDIDAIQADDHATR
jgi:hypothetical protein